MDKKNIQAFDWGHIEWIYEPESGNSLSNMNIGITTIFPYKRQNRHIHYGDEQVIYVLSGKGTQLIGDKISSVEPGLIFYIEAGSVHETINENHESIKELIISIPVNYEHSLLINKSEEDLLSRLNVPDGSVKITDEIRYIYEAIVSPMRIPVSIFDVEGNLIIKGRDYPEFCKSNCLQCEGDINCSIYEIRGEYVPPHYTDLSAFVCAYGLTVFIVPIMLNSKPIGIIKAGHIRTSAMNQIEANNLDKEICSNLDELMPVVPKGTLNAVLQQLKKLSKTIENYYIFKKTEVELSRREEIIQDIVKNEIALEQTLRSTKEKVLSTQINNHFLFNTLNAIAGMAIKENSVKTYQSIIDLSKMLRYTATNQSYFAQLRNEVEYLQNYINLQKLRYGEKLKIKFDISKDVEDISIPFNCLQPIIENCFVHGFKNMKNDMKIDMVVKEQEGSIIIKIGDNGQGVNDEKLNELRHKISEYEKYELRGLTMVYSKLKLLYADNFSFLIESLENKGTNVKIVLPKYMA